MCSIPITYSQKSNGHQFRFNIKSCKAPNKKLSYWVSTESHSYVTRYNQSKKYLLQILQKATNILQKYAFRKSQLKLLVCRDRTTMVQPDRKAAPFKSICGWFSYQWLPREFPSQDDPTTWTRSCQRQVWTKGIASDLPHQHLLSSKALSVVLGSRI